MKKALSILLALALMLGLVGVVSAEENVKLTVMVYERGNTTSTYGSVTDNYWTRWMQKNFGDPNGITLEYIPVPRANDSEKVNTMMAGGTAPDIIFSYDSNMIMTFGKDGGLHELSALIEEYGPNIKANMSAGLPYGVHDGSQWAIPALRPAIGRYATFIRADWLEKMGYALQKGEDGFYHMSVEDFDTVLHQAKELDLDETGMEIYPLGVIGAYSATQSRPIIYAFVNRAELTDEMRACYDEMFWPGYKEGVRYLNKLYNEGLIDPDFMVDTDTSYTSFSSLLSNGRMLAYGHDCHYFAAVQALYETNENANVVPIVLDNIHGEQFVDVYAPTGFYIAVPATCKNPEAAVKYIDFLADYENYKVLAYGFEGVHYTEENGAVSSLTGSMTEEEKLADTENEYERITCGDMNLCYNGSPLGWVNSTEGMEPIKARTTEMTNTAWEIAEIGGSAPYYFQGIKTAADEEYDGFLPGLTQNLPSLISCSVDEFDAAYDKVLNDWLAAGGQAVLDDKIELYNQLEAAKQ
jgi:putative aldouronate transport system substrate-binding protein